MIAEKSARQGSGCPRPTLGGTQTALHSGCTVSVLLVCKERAPISAEPERVTTRVLVPITGISSWRARKKVMISFAPAFLSLAALAKML